jgi:BirA family transcriptional regulator, biotin operon repressor / biotin---[acetyl-CoA-carboxylase] ligase
MVSNSEPLAEGTVIMADNQYAGRGQHENTWHAEPGLNLTASIFLKPVFLAVNKQFRLNMAISIALRNALKTRVAERIAIKWPNDIYCLERKLGGILIENSISGSQYKTAVIGIGINVNQVTFNSQQVKAAVSLREILQENVNLTELLAEICSHVEGQYLRLKGNSDNLTDDYLSGLYRFGQISTFKDKNGSFEGVIENVTPDGALVVATEGRNKVYSFKEIEFITGTS